MKRADAQPPGLLTRTARVAGMVSCLLLSCAAHIAVGQMVRATPSAGQIKRARHLLDGINLLETAARAGSPDAEYRSVVGKLSPSLYEQAAGLPESDLKTDLTTAVRFYEEAANLPGASGPFGASPLRCEVERPGAYRTICRTTQGSLRKLALAKARLHTRWAEAAIDRFSGSSSPETESALDELRSERAFDRVLAGRAILALESIEGDVSADSSLAVLEEGGRVANVSLASFRQKLQEVERTVETILVWLPENKLKGKVGNALHAYEDGCWWWARTDLPPVVQVSGNGYAEPGPELTNKRDVDSANYTAVANWRQARGYVHRARALLESTRGALFSP